MGLLHALKRRFFRAARWTPMFALCGVSGPSACPGGSVLIKSYGYLEIRPPSALYSPGAVIALLHTNPLEAAFICGPHASLGPALVVQQSRTMGQSLNKLNEKTFSMEANYMEAIKGDLRFQAIEKITMSIDRARIVELVDDDVINGAANRSSPCRQAIQGRELQGAKITMISSALAGDMKFAVSWSKSVSMSAKAKIDTLSQLAVELGGGVRAVTESEITAQNLVFGIRTSKYLSDLATRVSDDAGEKHRVEMNNRLSHEFHALTRWGGSMRIESVPDAPTVLPDHFDQNNLGWTDSSKKRVFNQPLPPLEEGLPIFAPNRAPSAQTTQRRNRSLNPQETEQLDRRFASDPTSVRAPDP